MILEIQSVAKISDNHILGGKMKKILSLTGIICLCVTLFGCRNNHDTIDSNDDTPIQNSISSTEESTLIDNVPNAESENQTDNSNRINAQELAETFGILILLPENSTWIADEEYYLVDENNLRITYHDFIADTDCTLLVSKNNNLNLPQNEYDETLDESWEGKTISSQNIVVKVQHESNDEKTVLATWEYNEYQFAIIGEDGEDSKSVPKTALHIIYNLD